MKKIKVPVLRYKSDCNTLTNSSVEIIPIGEYNKKLNIDEVYLLQITDSNYQIVVNNGVCFATTGIAIFNWMFDDELYRESIIEKIKEIKIRFTTGFEQYIKDLIKQNKFISRLEIELLYQFGFTELGQQAKEYMIDWEIKQAKEEQQEEEENKRKELEEQEQEKQKKLDDKWKKYHFIMEYIKDKTALQQGKLWKNLVENAKFYKIDGKIISFYNMVEMYINTTVVEVEEYKSYKKVKGEIELIDKKELVFYPKGKGNESYLINKTQYDYIEWRLKQVNN